MNFKKENLIGVKKETGSPESQVSLLTKKIINLNNHFKVHHKDNHSRRGLIIMINKRKKLMVYLKRKCKNRYNLLEKKLRLEFNITNRIIKN